ncbi:unnamed protein product, partial [marine sediment metagenome]
LHYNAFVLFILKFFLCRYLNKDFSSTYKPKIENIKYILKLIGYFS